MVRVRHFGALFAVLLLTGCSGGSDWFPQNRYGPNPVIAEGDVRSVADRQMSVLSILIAAESSHRSDGQPISSWYEVVLLGFNYADEKCDEYIHSTFVLDRRRTRIKNGFLLVDKTTQAILTATDLSKVSIGIVAQAFGFASGITDIVANSYLFSLSPALIYKNVEDARTLYRRQTETDAGPRNGDPGRLTSAAIAFARIRGYLALCFPHSIESRMEQSLVQTQFAVQPLRGPATLAAAGLVDRGSSVPPQIVPVPPQR